MKKFFLTALVLGMCLAVGNVQARPPYKKAIDGLNAETDAEKAVKEKVKANGCLNCHEKKADGSGPDPKMRNEYGKKLQALLPKFAPADWAGDAAAGTKNLRDAINKAK